MEADEKLLNEFEKISYQKWVEIAEKALKGKKIDDLIKLNQDDIEIKPIYTPDNININISETLPGDFPYLRGINPPSKISPPAISQIIPEFLPENFNKKLLKFINSGQNSIYIKFIPHTLNPDKYTHGVLVTDSNDFNIIFRDIDISKYKIYFELDYSTQYVYDLFEKYLNTINIDENKFELYLCSDPIAYLLDIGGSNYSVFDYVDCFYRSTENQKHKNTKVINANGTIYARKGATPLQEITFAFASALAYIEHYLDNDYNLDEIARKIHFTISIGNDFFFEIAKIRAMRAVWAFIIKELGGKEESGKLSLRLVTNQISHSPLDIETNILRATSQVSSALIAGSDSVTVLPYTFPYYSTDDFALRVAKNVYLVLMHETDLLNTLDPAGGSWYIESLTNEIIEKLKSALTEITEQGGIIEALKNGYVQKTIKEKRNAKLSDLLTRKQVLVGVNKYPNTNENVANVDDIRKELQKYLKEPFEKVFPLYFDEQPVEIEALDDYSPTEIFRDLRLKANAIEQKTGHKPSVFIAALGSIKEHKARVDFTRDFLATGGILIDYNQKGYETTDEAAADWTKSDTNIFVICSSDERYIDTVPDLVEKFKSIRPDSLAILAGYPKDKVKEYQAAGIDEFIHVKANIISVIDKLYKKIEN